MTFDWQAALALILIGLMMVALFTQARRNPVGTGHILGKHDVLSNRVTALETKIGDLATKVDLQRLTGEISALNEKIDGVEALGEKTDKTVTLIWQSLINTAPAMQPTTRSRK